MCKDECLDMNIGDCHPGFGFRKPQEHEQLVINYHGARADILLWIRRQGYLNKSIPAKTHTVGTNVCFAAQIIGLQTGIP
jgi:hypothetical protein